MPLYRIRALHDRLGALCASPGPAGPRPPPGLPATTALELFESQLIARHLDIIAFELRARGEGFYTITSAGHEANVVLGRLLRPTDPALLHYRSAALFVERARGSEVDPVAAVTLGLTASSDDPIAGGRHKVFGSVPLCVLPQTSTIGSHLPKAVGTALSLERAHRLGLTPRIGGQPLPRDAIVLCSLGDASLNHASSTVGLNAARWVAYQGIPLPLLVVCEDNGLGISVRTPAGWPKTALGASPQMPYYEADGSSLEEAFSVAARAADECRRDRRPVLLHLRCQRLMGHSGADPDTIYRSRQELETAASNDPLLRTAGMLLFHGIATGSELMQLDAQVKQRVRDAASAACARPKLQSAAEVMAPLQRQAPDQVRRHARAAASPQRRAEVFGGEAQLPEHQKPQPMGRLLNWALTDLLAQYPHSLLFGEDVAEKGGIYNVSAGLWKRFGAARVFNTLLDETTILALSQGAAALGLLPIPEIQYLAFLHNAEDQLRGEAASTAFFSRGQLSARMLVRIGSFGYQRGFGGHFHNDASIAVLRDIPGVRIAAPSNGADAVGMLRTCLASVEAEDQIICFLEPIALYNQRDLLREGDNACLHAYPAPGNVVPFGEVATYGAQTPQLVIVSYANGVHIGRRAAQQLHDGGTPTQVIDLRWLAPLPLDALVDRLPENVAVLVLDECRREGNVGEALIASLTLDPRTRGRHRLGLVTAKSSFVPLGDAANWVLPSTEDVVEAARALLAP